MSRKELGCRQSDVLWDAFFPDLTPFADGNDAGYAGKVPFLLVLREPSSPPWKMSRRSITNYEFHYLTLHYYFSLHILMVGKNAKEFKYNNLWDLDRLLASLLPSQCRANSGTSVPYMLTR